MTKQIEGLVARARELIGAKNDKLTEAQRQSNINEAWHLLGQIESTRSGVVDEAGLREILAEEMDRQDFREQAAWARQNMPSAIVDACLAAMRRVSKTDEGRNGVSDEALDRALDAWNEGADLKDEGYSDQYIITQRDGMRAALEAANICGRNAVIGGPKP